MQFKRPAAYPDFSTSKIVTDRRKAGLLTTPRSLYFPLRQKRENHRDFQHNVLYRLRQRLFNRGLGDAAYICPLFLDRAYRLNLHWAGLAQWGRFWRHYPWDLEEVLLEDGGRRVRFDRIPVFAEHISVPPHAAVTTASHKYSFTESGTDLCFHSPEALPHGSVDSAMPSFRPGAEDPIGRWFSWGDHLQKEYEIEQFAVVRWEDETDLL